MIEVALSGTETTTPSPAKRASLLIPIAGKPVSYNNARVPELIES